jgi:hypothetical protein
MITAAALGGVALGLAVVAGRRHGDDRAAPVAPLAAALLLSPILWMHYLVLLPAPIAIACPRVGYLWLAPLAFWPNPFQEGTGDLWRIVLVLGGALVRSRSARGPARGPPEPVPSLSLVPSS